MSRASADIRTPAGAIVAHAMYCGTTDRLWTRLYATSREAWDHYGATYHQDADDGPWLAHVKCDHEPEHGYAYTNYGGGFHWPVAYCLICGLALGPLDWDGQYDIEPRGAWPKDGEPPIDVEIAQAQISARVSEDNNQ